MNIQAFVNDLKNQFEEIDINNIDVKTEFKSLDSWDSLTATAIIVMIEDDYGVEITDEDIDGVNTIEDLFNIISNRKKNG